MLYRVSFEILIPKGNINEIIPIQKLFSLKIIGKSVDIPVGDGRNKINSLKARVILSWFIEEILIKKVGDCWYGGRSDQWNIEKRWEKN